MSIEGIIQRIKKDAESEAEKIRQKYASEINELEQEFESHRNQVLSDAKDDAAKIQEKARVQAIERAKRMLSQKLLKRRLEMLDDVYLHVKVRLKNLPDEEYRKLFAMILAGFGETSGNISVAADKDVLNNEFIDIACNILKKEKSLESKFSLSNKDSHWSGFILDCGAVRYTATLDSLLENIRELTGEKVIEMLF